MLSETVKFGELVITKGLYYKKFSSVPFSGKVTGQTQGRLQNGKWNGSFESYYTDGQLKEKVEYKDGKRDGPWVGYFL